MNKKELARKLKSREGMSWDQAIRVVNGVFEDIADEVANGNDVYIAKFGRIFTAKIASKRCVHPETKKDVVIPAHKIVRFRMAEEFRRKLEAVR